MPRYVRGLQRLISQGRNTIRSAEFADSLGINPSQLRKDLSYFGGFGTRGVGYDVKKLLDQLRRILKLDRAQRVALVGVGDLGSALLGYPGFSPFGFEIVAAFDADPDKVGQKKNGITVEDVAELGTLKSRGIRMAMIAVPAEVAQATADMLVEAEVVGILNFVPSYLIVPETIKVISIDIALDIARLPYYLPDNTSR